MKVKLILTSLLLVVSYDSLISCICNNPPDHNTYSYIALVEVNDLKLNGSNYSIEFNTIEQIKGPRITGCKVLSNHPSLTNITTSCDLEININEQWIICGNNYQNQTHVMHCSKTQMYRTEIGELRPAYCRANNSLDLLKKMYCIKQNTIAEGKYQTCYDNGKIEIEEYYSKGQLNGERYVYYKNGSLMLYQCFSKDIQEENEYEWSINRNLIYEYEYKYGKARHYKYYNSNKLDFEVILQDDGNYRKIKHSK